MRHFLSFPFAPLFFRRLLSFRPSVPLWAVLIIAVVTAQSLASWWFIQAVETWIEPGLFSALDLPVGWLIGGGLVGLVFLCARSRALVGMMTLAFLAAGFVFGLQAYHTFV